MTSVAGPDEFEPSAAPVPSFRGPALTWDASSAASPTVSLDAPRAVTVKMSPDVLHAAENKMSNDVPKKFGHSRSVPALPLADLPPANQGDFFAEKVAAVDVVAELSEIPVCDRPVACSKRRHQIRAAVKQLDRALDEIEEVIKHQRPSKTDKLTAGSYHDCFRRLHWVLERCRGLQDTASKLEDFDAERLGNNVVSLEYALLSVDLVARYDHATRLLKVLCGFSSAREREVKAEKAKEPRVSEWISNVLGVCGSRACMRDVPGTCASAR